MKSAKRVVYDPNNNKQRVPFEQFLKEAPTYEDAEPEKRIEQITTDTVSFIKQLDQRKRSKTGRQRSNWSPDNQAIEFQLEAIANIRRRVFGFRSIKKLTERTYIRVLAGIRKQWRHKLKQLAKQRGADC